MKRLLTKVITLVLLVLLGVMVLPTRAFDSSVVISEIKLGGAIAGQPTQFVEVFNDSPNTIDLSGYTLEYAKVTSNLNLVDCDSPDWTTIDTTSNVKNESLSGIVQPRGRIVFEISLNDNVGGSIRLKNTTLDQSIVTILDLVGWGSPNSSAKCYETTQAIIPSNGSSIKRIFDNDGHPVDTNNNSTDFSLTGQLPSPEVDPPVITPDPNPTPDPTPEPTTETYLPVTISELLPNPASPLTDSEDEFVEIYNPNNETVNLDGYKIQTGLDFNYSYTLPSTQISPKSYLALNSSQTNLTLSNTSSAARVLNPAGSVIHTSESYNSIGEDESWALVEGEWVATDRVTPDEPNLGPTQLFIDSGGKGAVTPCPPGKFRNPETNRCKNIVTASSLVPCNSNQYRSPETNRCRLKSTATSTLQACNSDQYRNPETNRCKKIAVLSSSLKPCNSDQYRNPETNRCKKIDSVNSLKPCDKGQIRNPNTNRCRKVAGVNTAGGLSSVATATANPVSYGAVAIIGLGLVGYGVYEYRSEIKKYLNRFSKKSK